MNETIMDPQQIVEALERLDGGYRRAEVEAAVEQRDAVTPLLMNLLEKVLADPETYALDTDFVGHQYATMLLAYFSEPKAHPVIVELASLPTVIVDSLYGDMITEDLPLALYRTSGGFPSLLKSLVQDRSANEYCRSAAADALVYAVVDGVVPRNEVVDFFATLFSGGEAEPDASFWSLMAGSINSMYPGELMPVIEQAYSQDLIEEWFIGHEDFQRTLRQGQEATVDEVRKALQERTSGDVHNFMRWWEEPPEIPSVLSLPGQSVPEVSAEKATWQPSSRASDERLTRQQRRRLEREAAKKESKKGRRR